MLQRQVSQPSSPIHHSTEIAAIVRKYYSSDGHSAEKPMLIIVSDGGPDHRVTYLSVKVVMIALFRALNLDMLVCAKTCPHQSWQNIAERIMPTLNLAVMNVSLCRSEFPGEHEANMKTLTEVRELLSRQQEVQTLLCDAIQGVICTLNGRLFKHEN